MHHVEHGGEQKQDFSTSTTRNTDQSLVILSIKAHPHRSKPAQKNLFLIRVIMDLKQGGFTMKFALFLFTSER